MIRLSLDPRQPDTHHARIFCKDPYVVDHRHASAEVNGQYFQWKHPLTQTLLLTQKMRAGIERILQRMLMFLIVLGISALLHYLFLDKFYRETLGEALLVARDPRILLFWIGMLSFAMLYYLTKRQGVHRHTLPLRPREKPLQVLSEDAMPSLRMTLLSFKDALTEGSFLPPRSSVRS